jgi:hypothetical protein
MLIKQKLVCIYLNLCSKKTRGNQMNRLLPTGAFLLIASFATPSWGFTITGNAVPEFSADSGVSGTSVSDNFMAAGLTLTAQARVENDLGFLSIDGVDLVSYTANQILTSLPEGVIFDFDFDNGSVPASSTVTNLTQSLQNVWIGDLDGDPISGSANTYDFISSTGQNLLAQRFFNGINNSAIEVSLLPNESLTIITVASDANPFGLGDDGRYIAIAESGVKVPEPTTTLALLGIGVIGSSRLLKKIK